MGPSNFAGNSFVFCVRHLQRQHGLPSDGVYGKKTHAVVAPHFTDADVKLYRAAKLRNTKPPGTDTTAQAAAKQLMKYYDAKKYHPDNFGELAQIEKTAQGKAVWSPAGHYVHLDKRIFEMLNWLISKGHTIGTYAMCSDHGYDSLNGHAGGHSVDISSIDGVGIVSQSSSSRDKTRAVAKLLHGSIQQSLSPWQLICDGYGNMHDSQVSACCIPNAAFFGYPTLSEHRNHIHVGYHP
jgi:hypothetical protein